MSGKEPGPSDPVIETEPRIATSQPDIRLAYAPAGRATLDAIHRELGAPGTDRDSTPELTVNETTAERDTLSAIMEETCRSSERNHESSIADVVPLEIFEMLTFVVRGSEAERMSSEASRQRFVEEHLLPRLPVAAMSDIERVDVTPWTAPGTLVVRIWCRVRR